MSLGALLKAAMIKKLPRRAVVVTIDDGYADSLHSAKPLLERFEASATVFVTSGFVGSPCEFWWDELEKIFFRSSSLPEILCLNAKGENLRFDLGDSAQYGPDGYEQDRQWNVELENNPTKRHVVYRALVKLLRPLPHRDRRHLLDQIIAWAQVASESRSTHRALGADELLMLGKSHFIEIGAHTVSHPVLAELSGEEQRQEIEECKRSLEEITGVEVNHFAYPFGARADFTKETEAIVKAAGFSSGCANYPGIIWNDRNRYRWPRILIRDWNGDEFTRRLMEWSGD